MIATSINAADVPKILDRLRQLVGERYWENRVQAIRSEIKGQPFLREHLQREYTIAFGLVRWFDEVARQRGNPLERTLLPAFRFAANVVAVYESIPVQSRSAFIGRVRGCLKNPEDMRALELEFAVATHFAQRGHRLTWPETDGSGQFDLLIHDICDDGLEVEVKSISSDKGQKIHSREALQIAHKAAAALEPLARRLQSGLAIVVTVPDRLPAAHNDQVRLVAQIRTAVLSGNNLNTDDGVDIRLKDFRAEDYPQLKPPMSEAMRNEIDAVSGTKNRFGIVFGRISGAPMVLVLQSRNSDQFMRYTFDTIEDAAKRQLSRVRPGVVLGGLDGTSASELIEVAQQDFKTGDAPTALRVATSRFLSGRNIDHLVGVAFLSRSEFGEETEDIVQSGGSAYFFARRESPKWHVDVERVFADL